MIHNGIYGNNNVDLSALIYTPSRNFENFTNFYEYLTVSRVIY